MDKKTIAVVFGGQSSEHEISCISVATVLRQIDESKYNILIIGITKAGRWLKVDSIEAVEDGSWSEGTVGAILSPDASIPCASWPLGRGWYDPGSSGTGRYPLCGLRSSGFCCLHG